MSNYQKGAAKERATIAKLLARGCTYARRIAGSRSEFDVVACDDPYTLYIQVKSTVNLPKKILSIVNKYSADINAMDAVHLTKTSLKEMWIYKARARNPIKIGILDVQFYQRV